MARTFFFSGYFFRDMHYGTSILRFGVFSCDSH